MIDDKLKQKDCGCVVECNSKGDIMVLPCGKHAPECVIGGFH